MPLFDSNSRDVRESERRERGWVEDMPQRLLG